MTVLTRAGQVTIMTVEAAGDGTAANAAVISALPTQYTILLVDSTDDTPQAIKLPEGNIGDRVEVYFRNGIADGVGGTASRLRIYDADNNNLAQTDTPGQIAPGTMIGLRKILAEPHSTPSGYYARLVGTWVGDTIGARDNYPPA